ncbi:MAG: DHH family phosphoesterase [Bacteroidales bacterium]
MLRDIMSVEEANELKQVFEGCKNPVIMAHVAPDGDAVGSALALWNIFTVLGKDVVIIFPDKIPVNLNFLPGAEFIHSYTEDRDDNNRLINESDLIICLDFNDSKRVDYMKDALIASSAFKVMIDHHLAPELFCNLTISHPEMSSTSMLLYKVLVQIGWGDKIHKEAAMGIFTGMMTDTGNFTYNSNNPEIYIIISELLSKGIDKDFIYTKACNTFTADKLRLCAYAISGKMEIIVRYGAAVISLTRDELNYYHYIKGDTEGLVNEPLAIESVFISAFFREEKDMIKVSLRSKGAFPVNKIASEYFNGGGHINAAGGEFYGTLPEAIEHFKSALPLYVKPQY